MRAADWMLFLTTIVADVEASAPVDRVEGARLTP